MLVEGALWVSRLLAWLHVVEVTGMATDMMTKLTLVRVPELSDTDGK